MTAFGAIAALRRFADERPAPVERCDSCRAPLASRHEHRWQSRTRVLGCVCASCVANGKGTESPWIHVPQRTLSLVDFRVTEQDWERLGLPIRLVFFVIDGGDGRARAFFPSPAGATESRLGPDDWAHLCARGPQLAVLKPDVEALLINHVGEAREHYLVSVDACYRLVGTLRRHWHGFSGGEQLWAEIESLMIELRREAACPT
jgi:hypothetical protein